MGTSARPQELATVVTTARAPEPEPPVTPAAPPPAPAPADRDFFGDLVYPENLGDEQYPHLLRIEFLKRSQNDPSSSSFKEGPTRPETGRIDEATRAAVNFEGGSQIINSAFGTARATGFNAEAIPFARIVSRTAIALGNEIFNNTVYGLKPIGNIYLPIMNVPASTYGAQWESASLGVIASPAAEAGTDFGRALTMQQGEGLLQYIKNLYGGLSNAAADSQDLIDYLILQEANAADSSLGNPAQTLEAQAGITINPYSANVYKGGKYRGFKLSFTFLPKNQKESQTVQYMIYLFKKNMHGGYQQYKIVYPGEFRISYYFNPGQKRNEDGTQTVYENTALFKTKNCALTNLDVTYGDDKDFVSFTDGSPVEIKITLTFSELSLISSTEFATDKYNY